MRRRPGTRNGAGHAWCSTSCAGGLHSLWLSHSEHGTEEGMGISTAAACRGGTAGSNEPRTLEGPLDCHPPRGKAGNERSWPWGETHSHESWVRGGVGICRRSTVQPSTQVSWLSLPPSPLPLLASTFLPCPNTLMCLGGEEERKCDVVSQK
jgi:hypothetical protein